MASVSNSRQGLDSPSADVSLLVREHGTNWEYEKARLLLEGFSHPSGYPSHDIQRKRLYRFVRVRDSCLQDLSDIAWGESCQLFAMVKQE